MMLKRLYFLASSLAAEDTTAPTLNICHLQSKGGGVVPKISLLLFGQKLCFWLKEAGRTQNNSSSFFQASWKIGLATALFGEDQMLTSIFNEAYILLPSVPHTNTSLGNAGKYLAVKERKSLQLTPFILAILDYSIAA